MKIPFMDFAYMHEPIKEEIVTKVSNIVSKGNFILGEEVAQFEKEFASYCGTKYCIGVSSGSDALNLSINALNLGKKQIISVSNTFVATIDCIIRNGADPQFVDIDKHTLQIDTNKIEDEITEQTKAIIPVDLFGNMPDWSHIKEIAEKHDLMIVEDACQAHGSKFKGIPAGRFGHLACFSFYPGKNLGAFGDGGAIVTNDEELRDKILKLRNYGQSIKYYHEMVGFNSRLDTIQAAILSTKLRYLDKWVQNKRNIARKYIDELKEVSSIQIPQVSEEVFHSYHLFPIIVNHRDKLQAFLSSHDVATGIHYPIPIHKQTGYRNYGSYNNLSITEEMSSKILSLPMYPGMKEEQISSICNAIRSFSA